MAVARDDPYAGFNFRVAIGGRVAGGSGFSGVSFPTLSLQPDIDLAARSPYLVLRRGYTGSLDLYTWWDQERRAVKAGKGRAITIDLLDAAGREPVASWRFTGCRPVALDYSPLDATSSSIVTETITLVFDDVTIE